MLLLVNISFYYSENQLQSCGPEHLDNFIIVKENGNALGKIAYDFFSPHVWRLLKTMVYKRTQIYKAEILKTHTIIEHIQLNILTWCVWNTKINMENNALT